MTGAGDEIASNTQMPLIAYNGSDYTHVIPALATSWTQSADGLTYTFKLRNDVYYSNGDTFNAYSVWWNIYRDMVMDQSLDTEYLLYFNATGVTAGDLNSMNDVQNSPNSTLLTVTENPHNSITVLNASAVQFHLSKPFVGFLSSATVPPWDFPDPRLIVQHGGVVAGQPNSWMAVNGSSVGTGPYVVKTYVPNQYSILVPNAHYWAQNMTGNPLFAPAQIPQIQINYKTDELTRELDLSTDRAQVAYVSFNDVGSVLKSGTNLYVPSVGISSQIEYIQLNAERAPLSNVLVRQAISEAINTSQIVQDVWGGYGTAFVGPDLVTDPTFNSSIKPVFNVTDAKLLLAKAGYPGGQGLPTLKLIYPTSAYYTVVSQFLVSDLQQIGVNLVVQQLGVNTFISIATLNGSSPDAADMWIGSWFSWPDFSGQECVVDSACGFFLYFQNSTINSMITQSDGELNPTTRAQDISRITLGSNSRPDTSGSLRTSTYIHQVRASVLPYSTSASRVSGSATFTSASPSIRPTSSARPPDESQGELSGRSRKPPARRYRVAPFLWAREKRQSLNQVLACRLM